MDSDHVPALPQIARRKSELPTLEAVDRRSRRPSHDGRRDQNDKRLDG
jgi:hypothetical protein